METTKFPIRFYEKMDKLNRDFLWGDTEAKKNVHLVNWDTVCQPKSITGLGIKKTSEMNQAMLAKLSWRFMQKDAVLWANMFQEKYLKDMDITDHDFCAHSDCSSVWRSIFHSAHLFRKNLKWRVGNGKKINFWHDVWVSSLSLIDCALSYASIDHNALFAYNSLFEINDAKTPFWRFVWKMKVIFTFLETVADLRLFGMLIAKHYIGNVEIGSDSAILIQLMQMDNTSMHLLGSLLASCAFMISKLQSVKLSHIFRKCNIVADTLAKKNISHELGLIEFVDPPAYPAQAFLDDLASVARCRCT
ncbi:uncharacterized protein LOC126802669 [Argentina anserina]|uniref:uncharacterized protein LOC126802669 n=1 Tax=Argentina anserina TaxID=57926 RepID=UPI00217621CD|nr:uncharacterized protein LOC126802669 [Potentilla anserina]